MMKTILPGLIIACSFTACNSNPPKQPVNYTVDTGAIKRSILNAPVISAKESIARMKVEEGFEVKEVASEPLVSAPVAMTFDNKGRIWVVEMQAYMPDTSGKGENEPLGKIIILEDTDHDGKMDTRKIFLDQLVMPRALCFVENGLLIAEPPKLWFVEINDNLSPGKKTLVDPAYAVGGNPEHQPNGLMRGMDNWVYNADSEKRYRKKENKWIIAPAVARGQWGISADDYGRLFYNNNSKNILGDYFMPSFGKEEDTPGFNEDIVRDNSVFPARPTPGVNRGYMEGILDDSLRLRNFTAASGPVIYRGGAFGKNYQGNAFVPEPSANLIKRNILSDSSYKVVGKQAYHGKEFLTSTDERFRPVTACNGPDGALYIVDLYRGIIQHKAFLTDYLKKEIVSRKLSNPLTCGRIYKVVPKNATDTMVVFPSDPAQLVRLLGHPNGWVRDRTQQLIIDKKYTSLVPQLRNNLRSSDALMVTHSFWTLEGLGALTKTDIFLLLGNSDPHLRAQAFAAVQQLLNNTNRKTVLNDVEKLIDKKDSLSLKYYSFLSAGDSRKKEAEITEKLKTAYPKGYALFNTACKTCHGGDGNGVKSLAPPLNGSEWVNGDWDKLISIILSGLSGPVSVKGKVYKAPEISGEMPGFSDEKIYDNEQIAQVLSIIRGAWDNKSGSIPAEDVARVRSKMVKSK